LIEIKRFLDSSFVYIKSYISCHFICTFIKWIEEYCR